MFDHDEQREQERYQALAEEYADLIAAYYGIPRENVKGRAHKRPDGTWFIRADVIPDIPAEYVCIDITYDKDELEAALRREE